jgi:hypothetical protein
MDEPVVEVTRDPRSSRLPLIIVAAVLVILLVVAWFYFLWPTRPQEAVENGDTQQVPAAATQDRPPLTQVTEPVIVITQHNGGFLAQEVRPLQLASGQYIYILPLDVDDNAVVEREVVTVDNNRVFGYTYVPEP